MVLGEEPIGDRVGAPPPTRPKARVEPPADPPARRAARPAERCIAEALEGLARLPEDGPARGEAEASPEVARRSFALRGNARDQGLKLGDLTG